MIRVFLKNDWFDGAISRKASRINDKYTWYLLDESAEAKLPSSAVVKERNVPSPTEADKKTFAEKVREQEKRAELESINAALAAQRSADDRQAEITNLAENGNVPQDKVADEKVEPTAAPVETTDADLQKLLDERKAKVSRDTEGSPKKKGK